MKFRPFEELFEIPLRNGLTKPKRVRGEGYKMINMGELFRHPRMKNIPMDRVPLNKKEYDTAMVESGDLLFARQSLVLEGAGQCSIFLEDKEEVCFESHLIRCRLNKKVANPLFYYYFFTSWIGKQSIYAIVEQGAGAAGIRGSDLAKIQVPDIEIDIQNRLVALLDQVDSKIELNQQTNQTLEQIAQALFKSWFVDFEPTRAKVAAKQAGQDPERAAMAAISGKAVAELEQLDVAQLAQLKTMAALFPNGVVESELGEVPEGWELGELQSIAQFTKERIDASELTLDNYVSTENMLEGKKGISKASSLPTVKTVPKFKPQHILISNIRPYFKKIWLARHEGGRSNDVLGFEPKDEADVEFLYNLLYQDEFFNFMLATSKGAKMPRGDKEAIMGWACPQPSGEIKQAYSKLVKKYYVLIESNNQATKSLEQLRDTLLPKLLSGELSSTLSHKIHA